MSGRAASAVAVFLLAACAPGEGSAGEPCDTSGDCPPPPAECVAYVCDDGLCEEVDLRTASPLPRDPGSGLPVGRGCRP